MKTTKRTDLVGKVYHLCQKIKSSDTGHEIRNGLIGMCENAGFSASDSIALADHTMETVALREGMLSCAGSAQSAYEIITAQLDTMSPDERLQQIKLLYFALGVCNHPRTIDMLRAGASIEEAAADVMAEEPYRSMDIESGLKLLRRRLETFSVTDKGARMLAKRLRKGQSYAAKAAALGEEGFSFKCIVTMHTYLENGDKLTAEQACIAACTQTDLDALGDAMRAGQVTETVVKGLLLAVLVVAALGTMAALSSLRGASSHLTVVQRTALRNVGDPRFDPKWLTDAIKAVEDADALAPSGSEILTCAMLWHVLWDTLPQECGKLAAKFTYFIKTNHSAPAELEEGYDNLRTGALRAEEADDSSSAQELFGAKACAGQFA